MRSSLLKVILFLGINAVLMALGLLFVHIFEPKFQRTNATTEATYSTIPFNEHFDFVIIGTSRAREFSRSGNDKIVARFTGRKFFNLSKGGGHGGIVPNIMAWKYFSQRGNRTKHLVYFIDSWVFFSSKWNEENYCLEDEPFSFGVLRLAVTSGLSAGSIINYFKSKLKPSYFLDKPISQETNRKFLTSADSFLISEQNRKSFPDGLNQENFRKYSVIFKAFIQSLQAEGIAVTFVLPPTLLYNEPGNDQLVELLKSIEHTEIYDHRHLLEDPKLFYDHPHMNSRGVEKYVRENPEIFRH